VSAGIAVGAQINHSGVLSGTHPVPRAVVSRERVGVQRGARMGIDFQWAATVGARVEQGLGPLPSRWLSPGVAYVSLVLVMITGTVGLGDRLACGWLIHLGWCIVPVSGACVPQWPATRLTGKADHARDHARSALEGFLAWRRGLSDLGEGAGAGASGRPL